MDKKIIKQVMSLIIILIVVFISVIIVAFVLRGMNLNTYRKGVYSFSEGHYHDAKEEFNKIEDFKNSKDYLDIIGYAEFVQNAKKELIDGNGELAKNEISKVNISQLKELQDKINNDDVEKLYFDTLYEIAVKLFDDENYEESKECFDKLGEYQDSRLYLTQIELKTFENKQEELYVGAKDELKKRNYKHAYAIFALLGSYKDSEKKAQESEVMIRRLNLNSLLGAGIRESVSINYNGMIQSTKYTSAYREKIGELRNVISIDTYGKYTAVLTSDQKVYTICESEKNNLAFSDNSDYIDVATGEQFVVALKSDGSVDAKGHNGDGQCSVDEWKDIIDVDAGWRFAVGLSSNGELVFSGLDSGQYDEYMHEKELWQNVVKISASGGGKSAVGDKVKGSGHTVGLRKDGTVVAVGDNSYGQCDVDDWTDIVRVSAGDWYTVGLKSDGSLLVAGDKDIKKSIDHSAIETDMKIIDIAAGYGQIVCLKEDGTVFAVGYDDDHKVGNVDSWRKSYKLDEIIEQSRWKEKM